MQPTKEETKERCTATVWPKGAWRGSRCSRSVFKDGYCKQHHPDTVKARDEKIQAEYERKRALNPLTLANKCIEELKQQNAELLAALNAIADMTYDSWTNGAKASEIAIIAIRKATS